MRTGTNDRSTVIVLEKRPRWAPELQRRFLGENVDVRACRTTGDIAGLVERGMRTVLVIDVEADARGCLQYLGRRFENTPPIVVIGTGADAALEWTVRELGAVAFLADDPTGSDLVRICRRIWNNQWAADERSASGGRWAPTGGWSAGRLAPPARLAHDSPPP